MEERNFISSMGPKISRAVPFDTGDDLRAFPHARAEDRMGEISGRLVKRGDRKSHRHGALSQTRDLRKDEPHPVALFAAGPKLPADLLIDRGLRVDETFEVERVRHPRLPKA